MIFGLAAQRRVVDPQPRRDAGAEVLHDHIGFRHHPRKKDPEAFLRLEVERDGLLAARALEVGEAHVLRRFLLEGDAAGAVERRGERDRVAAFRVVDLDHFGAHAGKEQRALRPGKEPRQVEHHHAVENLLHGAQSRSSRSREGTAGSQRNPRSAAAGVAQSTGVLRRKPHASFLLRNWPQPGIGRVVLLHPGPCMGAGRLSQPAGQGDRCVSAGTGDRPGGARDRAEAFGQPRAAVLRGESSRRGQHHRLRGGGQVAQ